MSLKGLAVRGYLYVMVFQLLLGSLQLMDFFGVLYRPMIESRVAMRVFQLGFSLVAPLAALAVLWLGLNLLLGRRGLLVAAAPLFYCLYSVEAGVAATSLFMCGVGVWFLGDRGGFWDGLCWVLSFFLGLGVVHWGVFRPLGLTSPLGGVFSLMYNVHHVLRQLFPLLVLPFLFHWAVKPLVGLKFKLPEIEVSERGFDRLSLLLLGFSLFVSVFASVYPYLSSVNLSGMDFGVDLPDYMKWLNIISETGLTRDLGAERQLFILFIYGFKRVTGLETLQALQSIPVLLNPLFVLASCYFSWEACRNGRVVAWCGFLSATGMVVTVGLGAYFLNNLLALIIALLSLGLLFRALRLSDLRLLGAAALGGGLLVYTHPWTMDQLLAGLAPVLGLVLYRREPGYVERATYLGGYLGVVGIAEAVKILFFGGGGGLAATSTAARGVVIFDEILINFLNDFAYLYRGFLSNLVLLGLAMVSVYLVRVEEVPRRYLRGLVLLSSLVYFVSTETNKSRILYNLPIGLFGALGLLWVSERRGLPFSVFVVAYSLFYLFASVGSLVW